MTPVTLLENALTMFQEVNYMVICIAITSADVHTYINYYYSVAEVHAHTETDRHA